MIETTELLKLELPSPDEFYDVELFNRNFKKVENYAENIGKTVSDVIDASKTFDVWAETKGVTYEATENDRGLLNITETLTKGGKKIAQRISEEVSGGSYRINTTLYINDKEINKIETYTPESHGWKGVVQ